MPRTQILAPHSFIISLLQIERYVVNLFISCGYLVVNCNEHNSQTPLYL